MNTTTRIDAGAEREALAQQLADWRAAGLWASHRARAFHRRVGFLARALRMTRTQVMADLTTDAEAILSEGNE